MARQHISFCKIVGKAAAQVNDQIGTWSRSRRHEADSSVVDEIQWPASVRASARQFERWLLDEESHVPPVVYYEQYLDLEAMGDVLGFSFAHSLEHHFVYFDNSELSCWMFSDAQDNADFCDKLLKARHLDSPASSAYRFLSAAFDACTSYGDLDREFALVVLRRVLGASADWSEVEESLAQGVDLQPDKGKRVDT